MAAFICDICEKVFTLNSNLRRHVRLYHQGTSSSFKCTTCNLHFSNHTDFQHHTHLIDHSSNVADSINCENCNKKILRSMWPSHLRTNNHKQNCVQQKDNNVKRINSVFKNRIATYVIENDDKSNLIPENFLNQIKDKVVLLIKNIIQEQQNIKINFELFCEYILLKDDEDECKVDLKSHQTKMSILNSSNNSNEISELYLNHCNNLVKKMSEFQERDSGWTLIEISHLEININKYNCIKGSQYIPLPQSIKNKKACINIKNNDEYCFKWAIISALNPIARTNHPDRCGSYKINNIRDDIIVLPNDFALNFKHLNFPLSVNRIKEFEANNPEISVNVFGVEENGDIVGPYYFTQAEKEHHINLLLLEEGEKFHYVWIKNISR